MPYRNSPFRPRKYTNANNASSQNPLPQDSVPYIDLLKSGEEIPMPNAPESPDNPLDEKRKSHPPFLLNFFSKGFGIEEIILIGVILLIIDEGIEDEFLILMLLYILLF